MVTLVIRFYSLFLGFYEPIRIMIGFFRIWKISLFSRNLQDFVNFKKQMVGYYTYGIKKKSSYRSGFLDDFYFYPLFLIDLFENKHRYFMRIE